MKLTFLVSNKYIFIFNKYLVGNIQIFIKIDYTVKYFVCTILIHNLYIVYFCCITKKNTNNISKQYFNLKLLQFFDTLFRSFAKEFNF